MANADQFAAGGRGYPLVNVKCNGAFGNAKLNFNSGCAKKGEKHVFKDLKQLEAKKFTKMRKPTSHKLN